ncbi:Mu transposase C-terminal domain-containing protein [Stieleria varia]|uniref:Mu transposase C-terminal domain-containing protein n=1 Tax=Stieleria varia TaxID=2528005 RepID=UPI0018D23DA3|nr:Mu transposase C-terminal domain-containing protein [Stieleria varia]
MVRQGLVFGSTSEKHLAARLSWILNRTDELFYAKTQRSVKKDNTFRFSGARYETPIDLRGRKIVLRHERHRDGDVIVYEGGRRIGKARLLDAVANGMMRRKETS